MLNLTIKSLTLSALLTMFGSHAALASSTTEVWDHHIKAWADRSVEAILEDYSEDSVLILNNQIFKGTDQISKVFVQLFKIFDDGVNRIDSPILIERFVYITWHFTPSGMKEYFGTDTFVIEDGKIVLQTIASPLYDIRTISSSQK